MSLISLKIRKKTIEAFLRSNAAMKAVAAVRLRKAKRNLEILKNIKNLIEDPKKTLNLTETEMQQKNLNIIIGCNQGMCGNFFSDISNYIKYFNYNKNYDKTYILGEKFELLCKSNKYFFDKIYYSQKEIILLAQKIYKYILEEKFTHCFLHFFQNTKIIKKEIFNINNSSFDFDILILSELIHNLINSLYESSFVENKQRVLALEKAKTNAEEMQANIKNIINKIRQENITTELNEIISGVRNEK